jgi:predicted permease
MLFWKIGGAAGTAEIDWNFCLAILCAVLIVYLISSIYIKIGNVTHYQAGSFSQSCYRFNTYIGMAIVLTALGEEGVRQFGIMVGLVIPVINVLAVSTLIWFSGKNFTLSQRTQLTLKALISNPLILACLAGILYARLKYPFPAFLDNTFHLTSSATLPLALLSIGGSLSIQSAKGYLRLSLAGSFFKLLLLPAIGYLFLNLFHVGEMPFKVGMIFFALPTSTAIYVLSSQLSSDTELASASITLSTLLSLISLPIALLL